MVALHPPLSGAPLSFVVLLVLIEILSITRFGRNLRSFRSVVVVAVTVATCASFFSGYQAVSDLGEIPETTSSLISEHHSLGRLLLFNSVFLATSFWISGVARHARSFFYGMYYVAVTAQLVLTLWAGFLGGSLVFTHGVGVLR
jgi:uncharacterized membrane protein